MTEILKAAKVETHDLFDLGVVAASSIASDRILSRYVGNSTIMSGGLKIGIGILGETVLGSNRWAKDVTGGVFIDGAQDIAAAVLGGFGMGGAAGAQVNEWGE